VCTPIANAVAEERHGVRTVLRWQLASVDPRAEAE
jgi:hypothetical protein